MQNLDLTPDERAYMAELRMLTTDSRGTEVVVGLNRDESIRYIESSRAYLSGDRQGSNAEYLALHEKHERVRLAVVMAESESRQTKERH